MLRTDVSVRTPIRPATRSLPATVRRREGGRGDGAHQLQLPLGDGALDMRPRVDRPRQSGSPRRRSSSHPRRRHLGPPIAAPIAPDRGGRPRCCRWRGCGVVPTSTNWRSSPRAAVARLLRDHWVNGCASSAAIGSGRDSRDASDAERATRIEFVQRVFSSW
jgi:hypothetical protein